MGNRFNLRAWCLLASVTFVQALSSAAAAPPTVLADRDRIVVMVSIDGLANFYMDDPSAEMPTIRKLAAEGARAASMRASDPTVTWTNHTTLVTGVSPAKHGVIANNYYDRIKGEKVTLIWDPVFDKDEAVKVPTLFDLAKAAGLKTAGIRWPATRNARAVDWNAPDLGKLELVEKYTTPALMDECKKAKLDILFGNEGKTLSRSQTVDQDETWTRTFNMVLHRHRPNLALLHVVAVDHTEHIDGPRSDEAYEVIKAADGQVRQVWDELQKDFPNKATLFIVSDHGFSANRTKLSANDVLEKAGLIETRDSRITGGTVRIVPQGGCALVYIVDEGRRDEIVREV
ncbi:MAG TPA: ectonucleotide pyrophosphatase/phosphodiesterase, partial [Candidatus Acidoferrum sp.]|nr:ectonucleotide pyrophosphatase/phosphodiesterase [Candidatus Acidoferrum sp.]